MGWLSESARVRVRERFTKRVCVCVRVCGERYMEKGFSSIAVMRFYLKQSNKRKGKDSPDQNSCHRFMHWTSLSNASSVSLHSIYHKSNTRKFSLDLSWHEKLQCISQTRKGWSKKVNCHSRPDSLFDLQFTFVNFYHFEFFFGVRHWDKQNRFSGFSFERVVSTQSFSIRAMAWLQNAISWEK